MSKPLPKRVPGENFPRDKWGAVTLETLNTKLGEFDLGEGGDDQEFLRHMHPGATVGAQLTGQLGAVAAAEVRLNVTVVIGEMELQLGE